MAKETVRLKGYKEFMRAVQRSEKESKKLVHARLREAGDIVRQEAKTRFERYSVRSASGYRVRSRIGGVFVEQSLRKTTGKHPEYGTLQMVKALEPAIDAKQAQVESNMERVLDDLYHIYER